VTIFRAGCRDAKLSDGSNDFCEGDLYKIMNLPNSISMVRILLVPVIIFSILNDRNGIALLLFLLAGLSDALDGFIARRFNLRTKLGAVLDPVADKLLIVSTVLVFYWLDILPGWLVFAIVSRDFIIVSGTIVWYFRFGRVEMSPSIAGKLNTFLQIGMIFLVLVHASGVVRISSWLPILFPLVFLTTLVSGVLYIAVWGYRACTWEK
jgi:cardiolipin synthase (CMP-forming)